VKFHFTNFETKKKTFFYLQVKEKYQTSKSRTGWSSSRPHDHRS